MAQNGGFEPAALQIHPIATRFRVSQCKRLDSKAFVLATRFQQPGQQATWFFGLHVQLDLTTHGIIDGIDTGRSEKHGQGDAFMFWHMQPSGAGQCQGPDRTGLVA